MVIFGSVETVISLNAEMFRKLEIIQVNLKIQLHVMYI